MIYEQYFYDGHNKRKLAKDWKQDEKLGVFRYGMVPITNSDDYYNRQGGYVVARPQQREERDFIRSCTHIGGYPQSINDKPAIVWNGGICDWYENGFMHRTTGPARIYPRRSRIWTPELEHQHWTVWGNFVSRDRIFELLERHQISLHWREWTEGEKTIMRLALS